MLSVDEYLNSSWHPDEEYVDGMVVDRSTPTIAHSLLQATLSGLCRSIQAEYRFMVLPEARTLIATRRRYRVPDILLCPIPLPRGKVVDVPPLAVIEITSADDSLSNTLARFRDYPDRRVKTILLMDPEDYVAHRFTDGSLLNFHTTDINLPGAQALPFDADAIFAELLAERERDQTTLRVLVREVVLTQQIFPVVIPVRRPNHTMDMLPRRRSASTRRIP